MDGGDQPEWSKVIHSSSGGLQGQHKAITLKFRPIAPKPANAGLIPPASSSLLGSKRERKRKYVRVPKGTDNKRRRTVSNKKVLPDLPKEESCGKSNNNSGINHQCNEFIILGSSDRPEDLCNLTVFQSELVDLINPVEVVESWVTVEYVMDTHHPCMDLRQENERVGDLEADTCPGFVTDAGNTVRWVNETYKRLVAGDRSAQVIVWLAIKDELVPLIGSSSNFSCLVKVRYKTASEMGQPRAMVVPCDVWRMEFYGGFAWRLDLVAALKLGCS